MLYRKRALKQSVDSKKQEADLARLQQVMSPLDIPFEPIFKHTYFNVLICVMTGLKRVIDI